MRRDERFTVGEMAQIDVQSGSGSVTVVAGEPGTVSVTLDGAGAADVEISQVGDLVTVRQPSRWMARRSVDVVAAVPRRCATSVTTASGDIRLRGELGAVRAKSSSGDVEVDAADRVEVGSASGTIRIERCHGSVAASTASGDVLIGRIGGSLDGSHASGDVRAEEVGGDVTVSTASGDVVIRRCLGDDVAVKTVSGDVTLGLPAGIRVHPNLSTLSGTTRLPSRAPGGADGSRREVRLRVKTVSGDIRIDRA